MKVMERGLPPSAYRPYVASPAWTAQKERWRMRHPNRRRCEVCGDRHYDLHHRTYVRLGCERLGWWVWRGDLVPLCRHHHRGLHRLQDRTGWSVETASWVYLLGAGLRRRAAPLTAPVILALALLVFLLLR